MVEEKKRAWYNRLEVWGAVALAGGALSLFDDKTVASQVGDYLQWSIGIATFFGLVKGVKAGNLPSGLSAVVKPIIQPFIKEKE